MNLTLEPTSWYRATKTRWEQEASPPLLPQSGTYPLQAEDPSGEAGTQAQLASAKLDALVSSSADEEAAGCPLPQQTP